MKRRALSLVAALAVCLGFLPTVARAAESDFVIEDGVLIKYNGPGGAVAIPDNVTEIADGAFAEPASFDGHLSTLTEVTIPDSVTAIGESAFRNCARLTSIHIPDGVTRIGAWAFEDSGIASIELPPNIKEIEEHTFSYCKNLTSVTIPNGVEKIGYGAFVNCEKLADVTIPPSVTEIDENAFGEMFGRYNIPTIHGVKGSAAETYAKEGYEYLIGSFGGLWYQHYHPLPFVAVDPITLQLPFQPLSADTPGFLTSQGLNLLFVEGGQSDGGTSCAVDITNITDERIGGCFALLSYNSATQAQFWFFDLDIAPGQTITMERFSQWPDLRGSNMLWVTFDHFLEYDLFILVSPLQAPSSENGYYAVDVAKDPDFLRENFGIR